MFQRQNEQMNFLYNNFYKKLKKVTGLNPIGRTRTDQRALGWLYFPIGFLLPPNFDITIDDLLIFSTQAVTACETELECKTLISFACSSLKEDNSLSIRYNVWICFPHYTDYGNVEHKQSQVKEEEKKRREKEFAM